MKGLVIERAKPSNCIDLYPLIKEAVKEGAFTGPRPSDKVMKDCYYYQLLLRELPNEGMHFFYLARRSKGYLGCLHAVLVPGRWDGLITTFFVDLVYVKPYRQKYGVGKKLIERLMSDAKEMGIREFEFVCPEDQVPYWEKSQKAVKSAVLMRVNNAL